MAPLRVGVVGLGEVAQVVHLPILETLPDLYQLTAICDLSPTLRKTVGDRYGCVVMVGYMRRFAPAFEAAKEHLARMGPVRYARVHDVIGRNQLMIDQTARVVRPDDLPAQAMQDRWARGSALVREALGDVPDVLAGTYRLLCGLGSHDLSALRELIGRPRRVAAARQWEKGTYIAALLEDDDFFVGYETGVDEQLRFDAHLEIYAESASLRIQYDTPYIRH